MVPTPSVRIDKWLWSVRLYKTRSAAAAACGAGKVQVNGQPAKPARAVRVGDQITAVTEALTKTVRVLMVLETRVAAKRVPEFAEDLTPAQEYERARLAALPDAGFRPKGVGRPTKRDRRILQSYFGEDEVP